MNEKMFTNPVTQRNIKYLKETGYTVLEPKEGQMADLEVGKGRLPEPKEIFNFVIEHMRSKKPLKGKRILVTAGATKEFIDPVRFISNGSSGRIGISIAKKAKIMGASVCLIHGEMSIAPPPVDKAIKVSTTEEMFKEVKSEFKSSDILIMAAAPSDFKPVTYYKAKIPKKPNLTLKLSSTVDILKEISREKGNKILVGFALQTEEIEKKAVKKMKEKNLDFIVANSEKNIGKEEGSVIFFSKSGKKKSLKNKPKDEIAAELLEFIFDFTEGGSNGNK
jgi:phosphopantothenoylcysteine decarboxylase/phosphopantothenate--cysteine ligase